ncbi:MAG: NAD(P)/FAD-dependent oxidoreductase [Pseudomonadota bacterium]
MKILKETVDTLVLGAGAAGMMAAIFAAEMGGRVVVIDHAKAPGEKIRISGGGRCNFTNRHATSRNFLSKNPHFCKSALSRYTPEDFVALVEQHKIAYHEKTLGQLFCDHSARDIIAMLLSELERKSVSVKLKTRMTDLEKTPDGFRVSIEGDGERSEITARHFIVASGGKSVPKMGASGIAYDIAERFGHKVTETRPALVPLTFATQDLEAFNALSGVSAPAIVSHAKTSFQEALLFTHRGLSGPAILQISSYWREGDDITVTFLPEVNVFSRLKDLRTARGKRQIQAVLSEELPTRLARYLAPENVFTGNLADQSDRQLQRLSEAIQNWRLKPVGTEGYRTAEVTLGGIETSGLNSRTMESKTTTGLYFIGEAVDVTGWLGGYNFQWAWASGAAAGRAISAV